MPTLWTLGDSILDCGGYNAHGVHPGALLLRNDDLLFPRFAGADLAATGEPWRLEHRAADGSRIDGLLRQSGRVAADPGDAALVTIGGNDLLGGLVAVPDAEAPQAFARFASLLDGALERLRPARVLLGTVYDPTFGDDRASFLAVDTALARRNLGRMNETLRDAAARHGRLVDQHAHFLAGDPSWFAFTIEPSLEGASEVRHAFLEALDPALAARVVPRPARS